MFSFRRSFLVVAAAAIGAAVPAHAATTADTTLNVTLNGSLSISAPASASLVGSVAPGTVITGNLGTTTVEDTRGSLLGWTVTAVTDGDLRTAGNTATISLGTLPAGGPLTWATGTITATSGSLTGVSAGAGGSLNPASPITVAVAALGAGGGTYTYNPTLTLTVPAGTVAGSYTAVVTQTVS